MSWCCLCKKWPHLVESKTMAKWKYSFFSLCSFNRSVPLLRRTTQTPVLTMYMNSKRNTHHWGREWSNISGLYVQEQLGPNRLNQVMPLFYSERGKQQWVNNKWNDFFKTFNKAENILSVLKWYLTQFEGEIRCESVHSPHHWVLLVGKRTKTFDSIADQIARAIVQ